jgi:hypothetical protein
VHTDKSESLSMCRTLAIVKPDAIRNMSSIIHAAYAAGFIIRCGAPMPFCLLPPVWLLRSAWQVIQGFLRLIATQAGST